MRYQTGTMLLALLAGAGLAACQPSASSSAAAPPPSALPLSTTSAAPLSDAPDASALPAAAAAPVAAPADPSDAYASADQAMSMSDAFGDSPPDYAVSDSGVTPWVWTASDNSIRVAEAVAGGERYYYYAPGADQPFYVQDTDQGYSFEDGKLVAVFDHSGHPVPLGASAALAGRFLARGEALRQSVTSAPHQPVAASNWQAQRGAIAAQRAASDQEAKSDPAWSAYHSQHQAAEQAHWATDAASRENWAADTDARLGDQAKAQQERALAAAAKPATPAPDARTNLSPAPDHAPAAGAATAPAAPAPRTDATRAPATGAEHRPTATEPRAADKTRPKPATDDGRPDRQP